MIYALGERAPRIDPSSYIAPSADLIGEVVVESEASLWFGAVARADNDRIHIGARSNVQDNAVLHTDPHLPLVIGCDVTVGHSVMLHGCTLGDFTLVGIGSRVLNRAVIGEYCLIGANTLITEGKTFPPRSLILGSPGKVVRSITDAEAAELRRLSGLYVAKIARYRELREV